MAAREKAGFDRKYITGDDLSSHFLLQQAAILKVSFFVSRAWLLVRGKSD